MGTPSRQITFHKFLQRKANVSSTQAKPGVLSYSKTKQIKFKDLIQVAEIFLLCIHSFVAAPSEKVEKANQKQTEFKEVAEMFLLLIVAFMEIL